MRKEQLERLETWLICLVSAHSVAVAAFLVLLPEWSAAFGGWGRLEPTFFARQAGIFHFVVAVGYLYEYFRYRGVTLLILAKSTAVVFLLSATLMEGVAWAVPVSALGDALMAVLVLAVHRRASGRFPGLRSGEESR